MVGFSLVSVLLSSCICASVALPHLKLEQIENSGLEVVPPEDTWSNEIVDSDLEDASVKRPEFTILPWFGTSPPQPGDQPLWMPSWWFGAGGGIELGWGGMRPRPSRPTTSRPIESDEDSNENSDNDANDNSNEDNSNQEDSNENDLNSDSQETRKMTNDSDSNEDSDENKNSNQSDSNESSDSDSRESRKMKNDSDSIEGNSDSQSDENHSLDWDNSDSLENWG